MMIPLQSQNQLLQQLSQLSSALCNNQKLLFSVIVRRLSHSRKNEMRYIHIERNQIKMIVKRTSTNSGGTKSTMNKNNVWIDLSDLKSNMHKASVAQDCKWKWSCAFSSSFDENISDAIPYIQWEKASMFETSKQSKSSRSSMGNLFSYHIPINTFTISQNAKARQCFGAFLGVSNITSFRNANIGQKGRCISTSTKINEATKEEKKDKNSSSGDESSVTKKSPTESKFLVKIVECITAVCILIILLAIAFVQMGPNSLLNGKVPNNITKVNVTFDDIKGIDSAKKELQDMVEFLKNPEKFLNIGAKLPKGVLLVGYPGTGKTLLARAVAAEANVPFFPASGSEFDGVLVGQGARKMKELFKRAKQNAPAVIFIDEIDSVGRQRTSSMLHPFANQTINQLLSEMDGFSKNESVIILGATNRLSDMDPALLRAGRFDVHIYVPMPDYNGRKEILDFYLKKVSAGNVDLDFLARSTYGFSSAALENLINQAAIRAAILNAEQVTMEHLEYAREKVTVGPGGKVQKHDEEQILRAAYHEAGHALVALHTNDAMQIHKITIVPHGLSLGHVAYIPPESQFQTKAQMKAQLDTLVGGRVAEELIYGSDYVTTNASDDLRRANDIAEKMVQEYGMSDRVGLRVYTGQKNKRSRSAPEAIDEEVSLFLNEACERAKNILKTHKDELDKIAKALIQKETMSGDDLRVLLNMEVESNAVKSYRPNGAPKSTKKL